MHTESARAAQAIAKAESLDPFFYPRSIAVVGASRNLLKPNGIPMYLLEMFQYQGQIYPVNPKYDTVGGMPCYPSVHAIPGPVDLAVIGVPAAHAMEALRACAAKGIKAAIVFTSGFAEVGPAGRRIQEEMAGLAAETGMRILGPNCLGILNYYNGNISSFFFHPKPENLVHPLFLSFITQSGGLGGIIYQMVLQYSVGFNYFVSTGNEADVSFAGILDYFSRREETGMIGGYLEGLQKDGLLFKEACHRALQKRKLVSLLKVGRTASGAAAAASHTGALVGQDETYDGLFRQVGVLRPPDVEELNALITVFAAGRIPKGKRFGVITISGGGGVVVADQCPGFGLEVVPLAEETQAGLRAFFPAYGAVRNPVDLTSQLMMEPELFQKAIRIVMEDPGVDMGGFFYNLEMPDPEATRRIIEIYHRLEKPLVVFSWPTGAEFALEAKRELIQAGVPVLENISAGLWALAALDDWRNRAERWSPFPAFTPGKEREAARRILAGEPAGDALTESRSKEILKAYGIPVTREKKAGSAAAAVAAAREIGYPVALKVESPDIAHKTEAGGVVLNLEGDAAVEEAFAGIMARAKAHKPDARLEGVLVQEMLRPGVEVIVGVKEDPVFGPVVLFGLGGVLVEVLQDVAVRVAPLREQDAWEMVEEIRGRALLGEVRGRAPRDREALVDILVRVSRLAVELSGELKELDINPLVVYEEGAGAAAADALIVLK